MLFITCTVGYSHHDPLWMYGSRGSLTRISALHHVRNRQLLCGCDNSPKMDQGNGSCNCLCLYLFPLYGHTRYEFGTRRERVDRRDHDEYRVDGDNVGSRHGHGLGMDAALFILDFPSIGMHGGPMLQITDVYTNNGMDFSIGFVYGNPRIDAVFHPLSQFWRACTL